MAAGSVHSEHLGPNLLLPAPSKTIEIPARHRLEPFTQSTFDRTCGLLSILNALQLALADHSPLTQAQCKELFADGIDFLQRKGSLDTALTTGMGKKRWHALTRFLAKRLSRGNVQLQVERPEYKAWSTIDEAFSWIDESLADGKPVLIALMGGLRHFTVVSASTPTTLQLFDSTGLRFVRKSSCGFSGTHHIVPPSGLLRIAVQVRT